MEGVEFDLNEQLTTKNAVGLMVLLLEHLFATVLFFLSFSSNQVLKTETYNLLELR